MPALVFRPGLRVFVHLVEGDSLRQTLVDLVAEHGAARAMVSGQGRIDSVRLERASETRRGPLDVIQLTGQVRAGDVRLALLATEAEGALVGGALLDARAVDLEVSVELLEAVSESVGAVAAVAVPVAEPTPSWSEVAAVSIQRAADDEVSSGDTTTMPRPGDELEHSSFGACIVEKVDNDEEFIMVRNPSNRLMRLSLEVLRLELAGEANGRRQFRARVLKGKR